LPPELKKAGETAMVKQEDQVAVAPLMLFPLT
jgi:hypothetical protein